MAVNERQVVREAAQRHGIAPSTLWGVYGTETNFGHNLSTSSAGAEGPFQFLPGTARSLGINPHDFVQAANGAARYLAQFKGRGLAGMLSAYNAGPAGGLQPGYVKSVEANAKSWGPETSSGAPGAQQPASGGVSVTPGQIGVQTTQGAGGVDPAALSAVLEQVKQLAGPGVVAAGASPARPAFSAGPTMPEGARTPPPLTPASNPQQSIAKLLEGLLSSAGPGGPESKVTSTGPTITQEGGYAPAGASVHANGPLAGLLSKGAMLKIGRLDEGQDGQTNPGGAIIANGNGHVVDVKSDPGGFGPSYPVVVFTSGPLAGKGPIYLGHTLAAKKAGSGFRQGEVLSRTGTHGVGNAKTPGWFEIGFANTLGQGNREQGRAIAPLLR